MSPAVVVLGSGTAVQTSQRDNTSFAFRIDRGALLIDCSGSPVMKLRRSGIDPLDLDTVVITHTHPDHAYGLPSLLHNLQLLGGRPPLPVFAPPGDLDRIRQMLELFRLDRPDLVELRPLPADGQTPFFARDGHRLLALPVDHSIPACAVRWDLPSSARVMYSSDTRPLDALADFGRGASLLIHEATFSEADVARAERSAHSTTAGAARVAQRAGARRLWLVHLTDDADPAQWIAEAAAVYAGPVEVPDDGTVFEVA